MSSIDFTAGHAATRSSDPDPLRPSARGIGGSVLVLHAHPDDEAIFTGATISTLADAGVRVVLVTLTDGSAGVPRRPLPAGQTLSSRRHSELEQACEVLGVARLHALGLRDSGSHAGPYLPDSLAGVLAVPASRSALTRRVSAIAEQEHAAAVVHYDPRGVYGHPDHLAVHAVGRRVAADLRIPGYEATVDASALQAGARHVLQGAAGERLDGVGLPPQSITLTVHADDDHLALKLAAMSAHSSQIGPEFLRQDGVTSAYRTEWFRSTAGAQGPLERVLRATGSAPRSGAPVPTAATVGVTR